MSKILIICGKKQAGKSTLASYIQGTKFVEYNIIGKNFMVKDGVLWGDIHHTYDRLNLKPIKYHQLPEWASQWCQQFGFADVPKKMLVDIMGLRPEQVFGTNVEKDTLTNYRWENIPGLCETQYKNRTGFMSGRDMLKIILTEVFRKMNDRIWVNAGFTSFEKSQTRFGIFNDGRHPPEIYTGKEKYKDDLKCIRLTRNLFPEETHDSEVALDPDRFDWHIFDAIIDNSELTELETFEQVKPYLKEWGWLETSSQESDIL